MDRNEPTVISHESRGRRPVAPLFYAAVAFLAGALVAGIFAPNPPSGGETIAGGTQLRPPDGLDVKAEDKVDRSSATDHVDAARGVADGGVADGSVGKARADRPLDHERSTTARDATVSGVTGDVVRIGVAYPDLAYLAAINPAWGSGDIPAQFGASLNRWEREGRLPIGGRKVELVFRKFDSLNEADQRSACVELMDEKKVFAILAPGAFHAGAECVAQQYQAPVVTTAFVNDEFLQRSAPYLYLMHMSTSRLLRNWVHWADTNQHLKDKTIGIYYMAEGATPEADFQTVERELRNLGYEAAVVQSTSNPLGGPEDQVAVQRFRAAGVDLALLMVTVINQQNFMQYADSQQYQPTYIDSDYIWNTDDSVSAPKPAGQYDGTFAMSGYRSGEIGSNRLGKEARTCVADFERQAKTEVKPNYNEWRYLLSACDLVKAMVLALEATGPDLTRESLLVGLESLKAVPMARHADVTFGPGDRQGVDMQRTIRWHGGCTCWRLVTEDSFSSLWVP